MNRLFICFGLLLTFTVVNSQAQAQNYNAKGRLECSDHLNSSPEHSPMGNNCAAIHSEIELYLRGRYTDLCSMGGEPIYVDMGCEPIGVVPKTECTECTVLIYYRFQRDCYLRGAERTGADYESAYDAAMAAVCEMAASEFFGPVIQDTGKVYVKPNIGIPHETGAPPVPTCYCSRCVSTSCCQSACQNPVCGINSCPIPACPPQVCRPTCKPIRIFRKR